ncbi:MAG: HU-CCDC81 and SPOR domain-containing protein [Bacteroidetes bacterium]|nr:HU-CCDC81 and SPOR domain-containing protein [Bacteroidota bacterium]
MPIEKYISELLFEHDCVIIPDFGGFVCNYSSANIHSSKHRFSPPFKKISFNRNLKNNDGLLANQAAQAENISYSDSNRAISEYVEKMNNELSVNKRFDLQRIGTFYLREENTLLFEQDETTNYLSDSFGLGTFYSPAIKRESIERKIERKLKDKIVVPSKEQKETVIRKRSPVARYMAVAASLLIAVSLLFVFLKTDLLKNASFANLNPFAEKSVALYQPAAGELPDRDDSKDNVSNLLASGRNDTTRYLNVMIGGNIPIVVSLQDDKTAVVKTKSIKHFSRGYFHIIGGAFAVPENAEKFYNKLLKQGYDATIIDKKLRFVSYGGFSTRKEALQALEKIRAVQSDAWLMRN